MLIALVNYINTHIRIHIFYTDTRSLVDFSTFLQLRALFYQLMVVLDDDETQTKGVVSVIYACLSDQQSLQEKARPDPQLLSKISKVNRAVPMKVMGRHFCTSDKLYAVFFRYYTSFMEKQMRMRSREHSGK